MEPDHENNNRQTPRLLLQAEKFLPQAIIPELTTCCPSMDLIAVATKDHKCDVYRFNGHRAFGTQQQTRRGASTDNIVTVKNLAWKYDGNYLAVAWSDGTLEVLSSETGHAVQQFNQGGGRREDERGRESRKPVIGWSTYFGDADAIRRRTVGRDDGGDERRDASFFTTENWAAEARQPAVHIDSCLDRAPDYTKLKIPLGLPEQLARIDVLSEFPKLPILPLLPPATYKGGHHPSAELFANQLSLDTAIHAGVTAETQLDKTDVLAVSEEDGTVRLTVHDCLSIGELSSPHPDDSTQCLQHAFYPFSSTQMFLTQSKDTISLISLHLGFLNQQGTHLQIIQSKTAELENLIQYVGEALLAMRHHFTHAQELPAKFMQFVDEDLREKDDATLVQALYQLACTGACGAVLKEWLVDSLAERGHKRWDHATTQGLTKLLEVTYESLLPALDRSDMVLSRLRGLFEYHRQADSSSFSDVQPDYFTAITDLIACLRLLAHQLLLLASRELSQFHSFSKWLRHEIDVQATDPTSASAEETLNKDTGVDVMEVLSYIEHSLGGSRVSVLLDDKTSTTPQASEDSDEASKMYDVVKAAMQAFAAGQEVKDPSVLSVASLYDRWRVLHARLLHSITASQHKSCSLSEPVALLTNRPIRAHDLRIIEETVLHESTPDSTLAQHYTYVLLLPAKIENELLIIRHSQKSVKSGSRHSEVITPADNVVEGIRVTMPCEKIIDVAFVDDKTFMVLTSTADGDSHLLIFPYSQLANTTPRGSPWPPFQSYDPASTDTLPSHDMSEAVYRSGLKHVFPAIEPFKPMKLAVNGRQGRRFAVVVGSDSRTLRVFDLDWGDVGGDGHGRDEEGESEGEGMDTTF